MNEKGTAGFTIAEIVLALSIASVIGLSVAMVSMALSTAHEHSLERDVHVQTARSVIRTVESIISKSRLVTGRSPSDLSLWASDANNDGLINVSELVVLTYNSAAGHIAQTQVVFPDAMSESMRAALDEGKLLKDVLDPTSVREMMLVEFPSYCRQTTLAENVLGVSVTTDVDPPKTCVVKLKVQVGTPDWSMTLYGGAALRADSTRLVGTLGDGTYVLVLSE